MDGYGRVVGDGRIPRVRVPGLSPLIPPNGVLMVFTLMVFTGRESATRAVPASIIGL